MIIKDIMQKPVVVKPTATVRHVCKILVDQYGVIVVDEDGCLLGYVTVRILFAALARGAMLDEPVASIMQREYQTANPNQRMSASLPGCDGLIILGDNGEVVGVLWPEDVQQWRENKNLAAVSCLETLLEHSTNGVVIIDAAGIITTFNQMAEYLTGIDRNNAVGCHVLDIIPSTSLPDILKTGETQHLQKLTLGERTIISNRRPIFNNGKVIGAIGIFQDLSRQELLQHDLEETREANKDLDSIIEACYEGIYISDGQGVGIRVNKAYERITGVPANELIGKHMAQVVAQGIVSDSVTLKVLERKGPVTMTQQVQGGKTVLVTGNPVFKEDGNIRMVITTVRNVTELHQLQKKLEESNELSSRYYQELMLLRDQMNTGDIIAVSKEMVKLKEFAIRVAKVDSVCLLLGESGVGKDVFARLIHNASHRRKCAFVKLNCGAIPQNLIEAELFGYAPGAFTGALKEGKAGLFEIANKGTLFLDEIGEMPLDLQVKLLQVIQDMTICPVGGTKPVKVDVRIISATNRDLESMVRAGNFRKDLFYRLNIVPIEIPPLRNRPDDILPLVEATLRELNEKYGKERVFSPEVLQCLLNYSWPGNVREVRNIVERMVVTSISSVISVQDIPPALRNDKSSKYRRPDTNQLKLAVEEVEKDLITRAIKEYKSMRKAARVLGVDQSTVARKVQKYSILVESCD